MEKQELLDKLKEFKKSIQEFHHKRWDYVVNISKEDIEKEIWNDPSYKKHDLKENIALRNAIYADKRNTISQARKKEVYEVDKSVLKQQYWRLDKYISLFSRHPAIDKFPCYDWYFLNDWYQSEENNFPIIISDIDSMIGKLEVLSEREFQKGILKDTKNLWRSLNPIWWLYLAFYCLLKNKFWSWVIAVIIWVIWIFISAILTPSADSLTKPLQNTLSGVIQSFKNK